jgi:hypothetical protein
MIWRGWNDLGGDVRGTPAAAGWIYRQVYVAARGQNGNVLFTWRDENGFGVWQDIGLPGSDVPAVARVSDMLCVFARGTNNHLWVGGALAPVDLGGELRSAPSVAVWPLDDIAHIFVRGVDDAVWYATWRPGRISSWRSIGSAITDSPAAVAWGPNRLDVFARGRTFRLEHCWWNGSNWSAWEDLGGTLDFAPCVVSREIGQLEVYYGENSQLVVRTFNGSGWLPPRSVGVGPQSTPSAFTFGPHHVEVVHTEALYNSAQGILRRLHAEGVRPGDDPASAPQTNVPVVSAPSSAVLSTTTIHCVARGGDRHLHHITYEDGFWGNWDDLGSQLLRGDPVAASPFPQCLDIAVRGQGDRIFRRRFASGAWGPWIDTGGTTRDEIAVLVHASETRILHRGTNDHLYEGAILVNGSWRPWRDLGGTMASRPHVALVAENALPKPANAFGPDAAIPAGRYVCTLGTDGSTWSRRLGSTEWGPWVRFADGNARVMRPLHVTWPLGFPFVRQGFPVAQGSQAGWIGRTTGGEIQAYALWWQEHVNPGYVSYVALDAMLWTTIAPSVASDPIGITMLEPFFVGAYSPTPINPITWAFARYSGRLLFVGLQLLAPAANSLGWSDFGSEIQGDPAVLVLWERFDDAELLHVLLVDFFGRLRTRCGGYEPERQRTRPQPSSLPLSRIVIDPSRPRWRPF